ncbi:MAG: hypothetical protein R3E75_05330 [Steroidobacteraceae bacterium]|nr:hypothetical protein [Nevskiaceae bacterium]
MVSIVRGMLLLAISAGIIPAAFAQAVPSFMSFQQTEKLADGLYAFRQGAYRSLFLVGKEGVIVTDPVSPKFAKAFRAEIAKITDQPVRYVVYSESHWDRISGGQIFKDEGAKFVAQQRCADNLRETPHPDVVPPDITYDQSYRVALGDQALDLHYFGPSLDTCLSVLVAQPAKMMMIVNLVIPPVAGVPWNPTIPDYHLYNLLPFFRSVEDLAKREGIDTVIGGFIAAGVGRDGKPFLQPSTGPVSVVTEQRIFWEKLMGAVKAQLDAGTPPREIIRKIDLTQFSSYPRYSERSIEILTRRIASLYITGR